MLLSKGAEKLKMGEYYVIRENGYLEHHGIIGQKWGIRRFQNKDGTRTNAGLKREKQYREGEIDSSGKTKKSSEEKKDTWKKVGKIAAEVAVAAAIGYAAANSEEIQSAVSTAMKNIRISAAEKSLDIRSKTLAGQTALSRIGIQVGSVAAGVKPKVDAAKKVAEKKYAVAEKKYAATKKVAAKKFDRFKEVAEYAAPIVKETISKELSNYGMGGKFNAKRVVNAAKSKPPVKKKKSTVSQETVKANKAATKNTKYRIERMPGAYGL